MKLFNGWSKWAEPIYWKFLSLVFRIKTVVVVRNTKYGSMHLMRKNVVPKNFFARKCITCTTIPVIRGGIYHPSLICILTVPHYSIWMGKQQRTRWQITGGSSSCTIRSNSMFDDESPAELYAVENVFSSAGRLVWEGNMNGKTAAYPLTDYWRFIMYYPKQ